MSDGAPDSLSETLSPREWATLEAALNFIISAREHFNPFDDTYLYSKLRCAEKDLKHTLNTLRRRRPRGESDKTEGRQPPETTL
jgi:hypothetical protein